MNFTRNTDSIPTLVTPQKLTGTPLKRSGHALSIVRLSKALKNSSALQVELKESLSFHEEGIPLLVSPLLLRKRDLGQIDLARLKKDRIGWILEVGEVKSSETGVEAMERSQKRRLFSAQNFLSGLFGHRTKLIRLIG